MRILALLLFLIPSAGFSQPDPPMSMSFDANPYINPAFIANNYKFNMAGEHRRLVSDFDGGPVANYAHIAGEFDGIKSAFGLGYMHYAAGVGIMESYRFLYAYRINIQDEHHIIPGVSLGLMRLHLRGYDLTGINPNDPKLIKGNQVSNLFDLGAGLSYRYRYLVLAISMNHINAPKAEFENNDGTFYQYEIKSPVYAVLRYDFHIGRMFRLKPLVHIRTDLTTHRPFGGLTIGLGNISRVLERFDVGATLGMVASQSFGLNRLIINGGVRFKWFTIGYAYDMGIGNSASSTFNSHQLQFHLHIGNREDYGLLF